jgi:pimeloyl-ACP methyl ester carboxylesterase
LELNSSITFSLVLALVLYGACCLFLYLAQRSFIYFPTAESSNPQAQDLRITSGDETLQLWQLNPGAKQGIIYFGGNAEDVAGNTPLFAQVFAHQTVYLVNYRGYGGSSGSPSEAGLFADAEAVYDFVKLLHSRIHVIGRSLGSGVAVHLATVRDVDKLVLVTPYDSIASIASNSMPLFPVSLLIRDRYDSRRLAGALQNQTLALLAENDEVIPRASSERLIAAFQSQLISKLVIHQANHNSIGMMAGYRAALDSFLRVRPATASGADGDNKQE